jgi:hexosaminidase
MKQIFTILSLALVLMSCSKEVTRTDIGIIPQPASVEIYEGTFNAAGAAFEADALCETVLNAISTFENNLVAASGAASGTSGSKFVFKADQNLGEEEYTIEVSAKKAVVKASGLNGFVYALESIKQLLPAEIYTGAPSAATCWCLPCLKIQDEPRFGYRGMHLDVSRHFFDANEVKKYIDIMAIHKLNVLHWHLTDDQGWRLEIKKYPQLTEHGAIRKQTIIGHGRDRKGYDNTPYGEGFYYTQDQVKEIIDYAAAKGIEIIPEIDLPGHMLAALACFPELGCTGGPYDVWGRWGIADDVLCVGKEETMKFLEDVLAEVADLFPSEYVHIGGDECPKVRWETCPHCQAKIAELGLKDDDKHKAEHYLQSYVTNRMEQFLSTKGKKIIGWDEILEGEIAPNATVMSWRGVEGGLEAVRMGHDAIMVPYTHLYLDYYQSKDTANEPLAIGGYVPVELVYSFEPFTEDMTDEEKSHILGIQANLWTEYIPTDSQLEYMLLPRLSALSEIQWCEPENKDYERFLGNMESMRKIYDILGYNYAKHIFSK